MQNRNRNINQNFMNNNRSDPSSMLDLGDYYNPNDNFMVSNSVRNSPVQNNNIMISDSVRNSPVRNDNIMSSNTVRNSPVRNNNILNFDSNKNLPVENDDIMSYDSIRDRVKYLSNQNNKFMNQDIDKYLNYFVIKSNINEVENLISKGADVNYKDAFGNSPLHYAARIGNVEIFNYLISSGANINAENIKGESPLYNAVKMRYLEIIKILIDSGANIYIKDQNSSDIVFFFMLLNKGSESLKMIEYTANRVLRMIFGLTKYVRVDYSKDFDRAVNIIREYIGEYNLNFLKYYSYTFILNNVNNINMVKYTMNIDETGNEYIKYNAENILYIIVGLFTQDKYLRGAPFPTLYKKAIIEYLKNMEM